MAKRPEFQEKQFAFAAHIRDPKHVPAPDGIEDRRMAVYRDLFFNNLKSLLSNMFPVLKKLHSSDDWARIIRRFMVVHRASTPYFLQLPREFLAFLENEYEPRDNDFPFLLELAHYEYVELALSVAEAENDMQGVDPDADL
ncbi:MAG: HvfC family RiPP maturation protein, partial [Woeseiaceae bacterium]